MKKQLTLLIPLDYILLLSFLFYARKKVAKNKNKDIIKEYRPYGLRDKCSGFQVDDRIQSIDR